MAKRMRMDRRRRRRRRREVVVVVVLHCQFPPLRLLLLVPERIAAWVLDHCEQMMLRSKRQWLQVQVHRPRRLVTRC